MKNSTYPKAPIKEAIIDIRVSPQPEPQLEMLRNLGSNLAIAFPSMSELKVLQGVIQLQNLEPYANVSGQVNGYLLQSTDSNQLLQLRLDGFCFILLEPYSDWQSFRDLASGYWRQYKNELQIHRPIRLGLRYINRIDIPLPMRDLRDYLRTFPEVSTDLDQLLSGYFMQLNMPVPKLNASTTITQAIVAPPNPEYASVMLDIDTARTLEIPTESEEIWTIFEELRIQKNKVFEASITNKTRELFY